MLSKEELRARLRDSLDTTIDEVNRALRRENTEQLEDVLTRIGRGGRIPKWYEQLRTQHTLPNLDGKTIGSVIDAADNWVIETQKDLGRFPNSNEWARILTSLLDGQIGMSPALQWRYNFSRVFGIPQPTEDDLSLAVDTEI